MKGDRSDGFSLVELLVVLAIMGLTMGIAAVYISSSDSELRRCVRNVRFGLERAKQEAISRNLEVLVEFSGDPPSLDCNDDGQVDEKDRCYVCYVDSNDNGQYEADSDFTILKRRFPHSLHIYEEEGPAGIRFSPVGDSSIKRMEVTTPIRVKAVRCETKCMEISYPVMISHAGRIRVGEKQENCVDCGYCNTCY